jgi:acyl carrier protein
LQADISNGEEVESLFAELASVPVPLAAIFHAAGTLSDAPILKQDMHSFNKVFAAKVLGTYHLHKMSQALNPSPVLVGFSSIASVLGPISQSNYAAANAFIDHLITRRTAAGFPAMSINWGPWGEVGMAARLSEQITKGMESKGIRFLSPREALRALFRRLGYPGAQSMICEFDWNRYVDSLTVPNLLYEKLVDEHASSGMSLALEELMAMPTTEREQTVLEFLRDKIARVLHFDTIDQIEPDAKLSDLGLDSLVAVELKNALESMFRFSLPSSLIFDYPSLPILSNYLAGRLAPHDTDVVDADEDAGIANMSENEVDNELAAMAESV